MQLSRTGNTLTVSAKLYTLTFLGDRPFARLATPLGDPVADLFYLSSVHTLANQDDTTWMGAWGVEQEVGHSLLLSLPALSSCWQSKTYRFVCEEERFSYEIEVEGNGDITTLNYFGGYFSGLVRWGAGFFWSGQQFKRGFCPEPNGSEEIYFPPSSGAHIDLMGVPLPGRSDWFATPSPFCFAFENSGNWLGMGVQAQRGQNQYTQLEYHGRLNAFHLSLDCEGHLSASGRTRLPALGFDFAADPYGVLEKHTTILRQTHLVPTVPEGSPPAWWQGPIFCGWGAQCHLAALEQGRAPAYARQEHYVSFMQHLEANQLHPPIVVIDDKWQAAYGTNQVDTEKWPNLPGFIAERHACGQKVLLWLKAWDPEGLPADECIRNANGTPIALDPTHPGCAARLKESIKQMLADDAYGADGYKIDFSARIPSGPGMYSHSGQWGLELMKAYLELIYRTAKQVKPDALIIAHTPHPYLADVVDMLRLNDINTGSPVTQQMRHRTRIARLACPGALIDTDNWPMPNKAAWREYLALQPELGVPALYFDRAIDSTGELLDATDYELICSIWSKRNWIVEEK